MATLYISEYANVDRETGKIAIAEEAEVTTQTVSIAAGSAQSSAFNTQTAYVRLHTDAICSVKFGTNPTASATTKRMAANQTEYFRVPRGQSYKVAVITNT